MYAFKIACWALIFIFRLRFPPGVSIATMLYEVFLSYTGCIKKTEQIRNRPQRREAAQSMKFFINMDCLGTYDVE